MTNLDLEERVGQLQPIEVIENLFNKRKLSKREVKEILYLKYKIDKHIFEYSDRVLLFLARHGFEVEQVVLSEEADLAKHYLIDRHFCLETLMQDENVYIARSAKQAHDRLRVYSRFKKEYFELFKSIDKTICEVSLTWPFTKCKVLGQFNSRLLGLHKRLQGEIRYSKGTYTFEVNTQSAQRLTLSEWELYRLQKIFDYTNVKKTSIQLKKSNLTFERVITLVHLFFEHLD
jgi:hypothetical protein